MTQSEINNVRIFINDPGNILEIITVATEANLPATGENQVAYYVSDDGTYRIWDGAAYEVSDLYVSDAQITSVVTKLGVDAGTCRLFHLIARRLGSQLQLTRSVAGAEQSDYLQLRDAYQYYKDLAADCDRDRKSDQGTNTGKIGAMKPPVIAGGAI